MEKKTVARTLQATKATNLDSKFKQDGQQKFPKTSRKREGSRPDPTKKPIPQRSRTSNDKRPRPRGVNLWDRDGSEVVEDALAEAGSTLQQGQKKMNLNHLLNFKLVPREVRPRVREKNRLPKYNKEQFLQANCQFVVKQDGVYLQHASDPDLLVDWNFVEEVRTPCFESLICPICLYQPSAAKITRCGHVYCWPCILHYLALSAYTWCQCPICHEPVLKDDLKSVIPAMKVMPIMQYEISMSLMKRKKGHLHALPIASPKSEAEGRLFTIYDDLSTTCFQKLLTASKKDVQKFVIERESAELQNLLSSADATESIFVNESLELLEKRLNALLYGDNVDVVTANLKNVVLEDENLSHNSDSEQLPTSDRDLLNRDTSVGASGNLNKQDSYFYFYQATDGQHIYLHPLNIRMLVEEFGSLEQSPEIITAKIVDLERVTVTESVRRRLRYLQHLPLTCEFKVVELQLQPPLLSRATCDLFSVEVEKRRRSRNKKAREERRRDRRIEMEENKKIGKYPEARYCLESTEHFPLCPNDILTSDCLNQENAEMQSSHSEEGHVSSSPSDVHAGTTSFAQMLRSGKVQPDVVRSNPSSVPSSCTPEGAEGEGEAASPPAYWQSFINSLDSCSVQQSHEECRDKGKKRKKKMLLFTTAINRSK